MIKNIIYVSHAEKGASGGAKIIYHHSEIINSLKNLDTLDRLEILIKLLPYVMPKIEVKNNQINIGALPVSKMSNQATSEINKILEMEY